MASSEKIKSLIETSKNFGILLDEKPEEHEILAKEILKEVISAKGIPLIILPEDNDDFRAKWSSILTNTAQSEFPQKTSIKLPKKKYEVKEVSYKEDEEHLSFIVTSPKKILLKDDIVLDSLPPEVEALFCFFEEEEKLQKFKNRLQMPTHEKTVFMASDEKTLSEKVFSTAKIFNPNFLINKELSTLFLAMLLKETNNFSEKITEEILSLGSLLLENGAQKNTIQAILEKEKSPFFVQILGRLLARTYLDEAIGVSWSFLGQRDLQKTNNLSASPFFFYELLKKIRALIPPQKLHILIWQSTKDIKALVMAAASKKGDYLSPLAQKMQAALNSRFFVTGPFESFSRAEIELRRSIKETIAER